MEDATQALVVSPLSHELTPEEANFVYNLEVLDMPVKLAASQAGVSTAAVLKPHIVQARENMRRLIRDSVQVTKEDIVYGLKEAIHDAKIICDPLAQIRGWSELADLLGYRKQAPVEVNINATVEVVKKQIQRLSDAELVAQLGAGNIIDGEFYEKPA